MSADVVADPHRPAGGRGVMDGLVLGCDYNPEQWSPDVWREDVALMREAGVSLVAINVFGWSDVEPEPGQYDFERLDEVVELLHENGIGINLGTGTASPPPWLSARHPEILPMMPDGTRRYPGGRQAWCPSSPVFREHAVALAEQVARRYGTHPAVRLWHVSNELGCHNALCYCDVSAEAFRRWLRDRYGTIEALNAAWGTSFWSQRYGAWEEIGTPRLTVSTPNPTQVLDFHRFSSDELLAYYRAEADVIRRHSDLPVTTNFMVTAHRRDIDYWSWAPHMDLIANDHYLDHRLPDPVAELAFTADVMRGLAGGRPWMLMEHSTSAVNWQPVNVAKRPGELLRTSLLHLARGADALCFFQWRASLQGAEKFHSALLPHAGTDSDVWREVVDLGATLRRLSEVAGSRARHDVALVFSYEAWWAADGESHPSEHVRYLEQVHHWYRALRAAGIGVDVVAPGASLDGYRLVVVPELFVVRDDEAAVLTRYVEQGGHALVTYFSGIVDQDLRVRPGGYPGAFRDALGVRVEEFHPLLPGRTVTLDDGGTASLWTEALRTTTAETVVRVVDGPLPGTPAVTRNRHGRGTAWYVATTPDHEHSVRILLAAANEADVAPLPGAGTDVDVVRRTDGDRSWLFVLNHGTTPVELDAPGFELVEQQPTTRLTVPAGAVRVVREEVPR